MKKSSDRFEKSFRNAEQVEQILHARPSFHEAVEKFRLKWNIPEKGLLHGQQYLAWQEWRVMPKTSPKPTRDDIDLEVARQLRMERRSRSQIFNMERLLTAEHIEKPDVYRMFKNDIAKILIDETLTPRWFDYVHNYLLFNEKEHVPSGVELQLGVDDATGIEILMLKITGEIGKEDLLAALPAINKYQAELPYRTAKKIQPKRAFEKYKKVEEIYTSQGVNAAIDWLETNYPKGNGDVYMGVDVQKMRDEYKKAIRRN